ncbi:MAG: MgtC/SapB family protein [Desulfuromusa sp.]
MFFDSTLFGSYELMIFLKLLLATLAGGIIGYEREKHGRPAGLRTHLLVCAGSCLMMIISEAFFLKYGNLPGTGVLRLDPGRAAAQIITGIGFLGAGVIIKEGFIVRGLTTAACLWMVAGIGMAFGMGMVTAGIIGTVVALFSLIALKKLEPRIKKDRYLHLNVTATAEPDIYPQLEDIFSARALRLSNVETDLNLKENTVVYRFVITRHKERIGRELSKIISGMEGVQKIHFK